jgi:chromosome segregation ATPase
MRRHGDVFFGSEGSTVKKADLYVEGARLPEHLSRLLFLEGVVVGRRVLEVGTRSAAVARFLLELGAAKVVCVVDDREQLEALRRDNDLERVDYRSVRPASGSRPPGPASAPLLPGDDGAFDLVIDFSVPDSLTAGSSERLADIKRLLSPEGFALTALSSTSPGISALLPGQSSTTIGYRDLVGALQERFELVQVYFQSLLMGFLFGSFDHAPSGDGIAPQTQLMRDEPEPACAYVFAFGNAVPVIEDVCLVQVPFDALIGAVEERVGRRREDAARASPADDEAEAFFDRTEQTLFEPNASLAAEVALRDAHIAALELALTDARRHDPHVTLIPDPRSPRGEGSDDEPLVRLARELDDAMTRAAELEDRAQRQDTELIRAFSARDELRADRDMLAEQLVSVDAAHVALQRQLREVEEDLGLTRLRIQELEDLCVEFDAQRAALTSELLETRTVLAGERLRANAERELLNAAVAENESFVQELQEALAATGVMATDDDDVLISRPVMHAHLSVFDADRRALEENDGSTVTVAGRLLTSLAQRFAAVDERASAAEQEREALSEALARAESEREAHAHRHREALAQAERAFESRLHDLTKQSVAEARARIEAMAEELTSTQHRLHTRTDEAARLARAVQELLAERAADDQRATALAAAIARSQTLASEAQRTEDRRRADHRILEEVRVKLEGASREAADLLGQRRVLQDALGARERDWRALVEDAEALRASVAQEKARADSLARAHDDAQSTADALARETRRLQGALQEALARSAAVCAERDALSTTLAEGERERAEHTCALAEAHLALSTAERRAVAADEALAQTIEAAGRDANAARDREQELLADHARTRDELAELTTLLLELEAQVADERSQVAGSLAQAQRDIASLSTTLNQRDATIVALSQEITALQASHTALAADANKALADAAVASTLTAERARLEHELELTQRRATDVEAGLRRERDAALAGLTEGRAALDVATASIASLRATIESLTEAHHDALARERNGQASVEQLKADLAARSTILEDVTHQLGALRAEFTSLSSGRQELLAERADTKGELADVSREADALRIANDASRREILRLQAGLGEARSLLDVERGRSELLSEESREVSEALNLERARADDLSARLNDAQLAADRAQARERERGDLLAALLEEARHVGEQQRARADGLLAVLSELQDRATQERARGDAFSALLDEAQQILAYERARGNALGAQLAEAQEAARRARAQGDVLAGVIDEARDVFAAQRSDTKRSATPETDHGLEELRRALKREQATSIPLRAELADARARAESLASELLGLRDALATAREDAAEALEAAHREIQELSTRDGVASAAHPTHGDDHDAAESDDDDDDARETTARLAHVEAELVSRDETIADLRVRIDRLTERLVRSESHRS